MPQRTETQKARPVPTLATLKLEGNWEDALKKSFGKRKRVWGWPK